MLVLNIDCTPMLNDQAGEASQGPLRAPKGGNRVWGWN